MWAGEWWGVKGRARRLSRFFLEERRGLPDPFEMRAQWAVRARRSWIHIAERAAGRLGAVERPARLISTLQLQEQQK